MLRRGAGRLPLGVYKMVGKLSARVYLLAPA